VDARTVSNLRTRTRSIELHASVEWDGSRIYEHAHSGGCPTALALATMEDGAVVRNGGA